jgi:hypothetical protein
VKRTLRPSRRNIHRNSKAGKPLSDQANETNRKRSKVRARIDRIFAALAPAAMGGKLLRTIGVARGRFKIGMMNLVCNMRRMSWLANYA